MSIKQTDRRELRKNTVALAAAMNALLEYQEEYEIEEKDKEEFEDNMENLRYYLIESSKALMNEICEDYEEVDK
jgi:tRNA U34 5-carboxymethylaminomethyl modifying GTPase MnmE/TrmE